MRIIFQNGKSLVLSKATLFTYYHCKVIDHILNQPLHQALVNSILIDLTVLLRFCFLIAMNSHCFPLELMPELLDGADIETAGWSLQDVVALVSKKRLVNVDSMLGLVILWQCVTPSLNQMPDF
jgi:hypothetical protein